MRKPQKDPKEGISLIKTHDGAEILQTVFLPDDEIACVHAVMAQCFFPVQRCKEQDWQMNHGKASLLIRAGKLIDPSEAGRFVQQAVPSGAKARLAITYIQREVIRRNSRVVNMGSSMRDFMRSNGVKISGQNGKELTRQINNLAAATITVAGWQDGHARSRTAQIADGVDFWLERDERQHTLWQPELEISPQYHDLLKEHRVPINWAAYVQLQSNPRAQDAYMWMSYRLPRIPRNRPLKLKYTDHLQPIFGTDSNLRRFRDKMERTFTEAVRWYPGARVDFLNDGARFYFAPSPVSEKAVRA